MQSKADRLVPTKQASDVRFPHRIGNWTFLTGEEEVPDIMGTTTMLMYPIVRTPKWAIVVRHILKPNVESHLHTHGFPYITLILKGWYVEERNDRPGTRKRRFGQLNWISQKVGHRLLAASQGGVWTLGFHMKWLASPEYPTVMLVDGKTVPCLDYYKEHRPRV